MSSNWIFYIFLGSIWLLVILGRIKLHFPGIYRFFSKKFNKGLTDRMLEKGQIDKIISNYIMLSEKTKPLKYYYLGYSSLYSLKPDDAIFYFKKHLPLAIGKQVQDTKGLMAIAYMQKKAYFEAYELLEMSRKEGRVLIVPYTLMLLVTSQYDQAKDFFELNAENKGLSPSVRKSLETLVSFDGAHPVTIENIPNTLYIYHSMIETILEQYSMEIYFKDPFSSKKLQEEIRTAMHTLSEHPSFFQSKSFQWVRKYLQEFSVDQPVWFTGIEFIFSVYKVPPVELLLKKIKWLCRDSSQKLKPNEIHELFFKMLPSEVKQTFHHESPHLQYVVFKDEKMKLGFHKSVICEEDYFQFQFRLLSLKELQEMNLLIPLESSFQLAPEDIQWQFERIMYEWTENRTKKLYWLEHVVPLIENIPSEYQSSLDGIKRFYKLRQPF